MALVVFHPFGLPYLLAVVLCELETPGVSAPGACGREATGCDQPSMWQKLRQFCHKKNPKQGTRLGLYGSWLPHLGF